MIARPQAGLGSILRGRWLALLVLALVPLWVHPAAAADDNKVFYPGAATTESPSKTTTSTLNSFSLILGLALAGVGGWLVWRNRTGKPLGRDHRLLAIDETRSLGNRQYLVVASYEGKKFLLGVCPGRIDMLTPLDGSAARPAPRE